MDIWQAWDVTKKALDYRKVEAVAKEESEKGSLKDALLILAFASIYSSLLSILMNVMSLYTARAFYVLVGVPVAEIELDAALLAPYVVYFFGLILPLGLIVIFVSQFLQFRFLKFTGGAGSWDKQLYLYSLLTLGISIASTLLLSMFFSCLSYFVLIFFFGFIIYVQFYLQTKMIAVLHKVSMLHALASVVIGALAIIAIMLIASEVAAIAGIGMPVAENILNIPENALGEYNAI